MTLHSNIGRIARDLDETVGEALDASADLVAAEAKLRAPVATGELRSSIVVDATEEETGRVIRAEAFYARFVEEGTVFVPARPFLIPAFERHRDVINDRIRAALQRSIDRGGRF